MGFSSFKEVIEEGDTVILYVGVTDIYALEIKATILNKKNQEVENVFQTKYGCLKVISLVGKKYGSKVFLSKGYAHVLYPTPELWTVTLPHRTQILYTPDISMIIMELDIKSGSIVCEAGTGSGSLSHAFLRSVGKKGHLYTCDFHEQRVALAKDEFKRHGYEDRVTVTHRDVCANGWGVEEKADAVFLDLPNPWSSIPHAIRSIKKSGGRICSFSPCIEQVMKSCELMSKYGLTEIVTLECLQREFQIRNITCPSASFKIEEKTDELSIPKNGTENEESLEPEVKKMKSDNAKESNLNAQNSNTNNKLEKNDKNISSTDINQDVDNLETNKTDDMEISKCAGEKINSSPANKLEKDNKNLSNVKSKEFKNKLKEVDNNFKFKAAVPLLKMPGHTGYLTFATVVPNLSRNFEIKENDDKKDGEES